MTFCVDCVLKGKLVGKDMIVLISNLLTSVIQLNLDIRLSTSCLDIRRNKTKVKDNIEMIWSYIMMGDKNNFFYV